MTFILDLFRGRDWIQNSPKGINKLSRYHWFNMVSPSPWPILLATNTLPIVLGLVGYLQGINNSLEMLIIGFVTFLFFFTMWNRDIIRESTFMGVHTKQVDANTILGFKLFLFSEIMLFISFFWAHLYSALYPSVFIGLSWPPVGLSDLLLDPFDIPLTNTVILVYSGFTVTLSHLYLRRGSIFLSAVSMAVTIVFGMAFLYIQYSEYAHAEFDISDGIYGSTFYMLTGFHGGHVIIGVTALIITLIRLIELHFSSYSHTGYKLALIYWHFVDVVWIFVFLIVYVLGYDLTYPNIIYYTNSNYLGCIVNLDQAFFGKWWRGVKILEDSHYINSINNFERICWSELYFGENIYTVIGNLTFYNFYSNTSTFKVWFTTRRLSEYTMSDKTQYLNALLANDQSELTRGKSKELEWSFYRLVQLYYRRYLEHFSNIRYLERPSQWINGFEEYQKEKAHKAINLFYVSKCLPSFVNDFKIKNGDEGLNSFYKKLFVLNKFHKEINDLSIRSVMDNKSYTYGIDVWRKFWPNNVTRGIIPKWLRIMYTEAYRSHGYPGSIARDRDLFK
uniref:Cytochrome c oxidase subunit 3 n=1 Tax=Paramoeba pemaquidensis TaxID=180228 RepID=A0A1D8D5G3_9EUKA|nr:cytochrome c oxidase 3 [Paramoeba pemaquidensis]AOS85555.1 cytochrome c oxidase 3 [Paramoeba pemaquidensis]